jgi:hypothetical protein
VGDTNQDQPYRQKGGSAMVEKTIFGLHRVGASFMKSKSDFLSITSYAVHGRFSFKEGSAILTEIGQTNKDEKNGGAPASSSRYGLFQTYVRPWRGVYALANIEYQRPDIRQDDYQMRWGPGLQFFPIQRIELRADVYDTRNFLSKNSTRDSWMYLLQAHVWL